MTAGLRRGAARQYSRRFRDRPAMAGRSGERMDERERADRTSYWRAKLAAETEHLEVLRKVETGEGDFVLVDTRPREAFERERIPGAISLPADEIGERPPDLELGRKYVLYCWRST